jgi:cysteine desulfurase
VESESAIYLDHHATTPCDPRVVDAMLPYFAEEFGNPASRTHRFGWRAQEAVDRARRQVAEAIGAHAREIVFASGATEANNLAILGTARASRARGDHVVTCATEHRAVLDPCRALEKEGFRVTVLPVRPTGIVDLAALEAKLEPSTLLISVMLGNNEIGTLQPLAEIARIARERHIVLHTDAAQAVGKIPVDVERLGVDLLSFTAHKLYGPKGVGALYVRRRRPTLEIAPLLHGGGHERGLRSGTLPAPLCVGFGEACAIAARELDAEAARIGDLRDRLWTRLSSELDGVSQNGASGPRLPGNLNVSFAGVEAEALLMGLPELALSTGSACTSATPEPSHVLRALGLGKERALSAVRFGLGRFNTRDEIDLAAERVVVEVRRLRALAAGSSTGRSPSGVAERRRKRY